MPHESVEREAMTKDDDEDYREALIEEVEDLKNVDDESGEAVEDEFKGQFSISSFGLPTRERKALDH
jgi:hypothetical protein